MGLHRLLRIFLQADPLRALWSENADTDRIQRKADLL